jgi:hypothetical protein
MLSKEVPLRTVVSTSIKRSSAPMSGMMAVDCVARRPES